MCEPSEFNVPCAHDHTEYSAELIQKLRLYFLRLSKVDQRVFVSPGVRSTFDGDRIAKGGDLSNVKIHGTFRLESPAILEERLTQACLDSRPLPVPLHSDCNAVCLTFLLFAVDRSLNWFNQINHKLPSRSYEQDETDRAFDIDPARRYEDERSALKTRHVVDWLKQQRREHLIMPNETHTVLPYKDKREAHGAFALDLERLVKFEHRDASVDLVFANGLAMDDVCASPQEADLMERDDNSEQRANDIASATPAKSRYGNIVMGPKNQLPESKHVAGFSWFCSVWQTHEEGLYKKTIKIRKWMPFAKCDDCATHRQTMKETKCQNRKRELMAQHREHLERVKRERLSYLMRQHLSIMYPERYLSLIIDGADSSNMQIPHLAERSHLSDACPLVKMHILGCIAHGRDTYAFTCPPHIAQGHNITIQVLHYVLLAIKRCEGSIPPIIHVQLDNTTKQNKGRFLMAYLAFLVQMGVIKQAYCNFLPVGHTHEDIDQFFSRVSVFCRHHNAPDVETLLWCIRSSFKKRGRHPIVAAWDTVANISEYLARFTHPHLSRDITLYYQLRIVMGRSGEIAGMPIMQARTWPGADEDDKNDYWRGLDPNTSYVVIFKTPPSLHTDRDIMAPQQQPQHIDTNPNSEIRATYTTALVKQREMIEKLMEYCPAVFTDEKKTNVRRLLDSLGSNLRNSDPVQFDWKQADLDYLYGQGQYVAHPSLPIDDIPVDPNLFDDSHLLEEIKQNRPDGMRDPESFQQALDRGEIDLKLVENVQACTLAVGSFYIQRATDYVQPFALVKVVRIIMNDDKTTQWGAFVHPWEPSTMGDINYFVDPWHASGEHLETQRYNPRLDDHNQTWNYPRSILREFQEPVNMNKGWTKPKYCTSYSYARMHDHMCIVIPPMTLRNHSAHKPHVCTVGPGRGCCAPSTA
jgi:hypothetical protein